jgi:hypothetical protein
MPSDFDSKACINRLMDGLEPTFMALGFKRYASARFIKRSKSVELRYILLDRRPRGPDPHRLYVSPCLHVLLYEVESLAAALQDRPVRKGFPTLGGSVGLYNGHGHYQEWAIDDVPSALSLVPQLLFDVQNTAIPFWNALSDRRSMLEAVESESKWADRSANWIWQNLALLHLERGIETAMAFVATNGKKLRGADEERIRTVLGQAVR